jgi:hypothetical protein
VGRLRERLRECGEWERGSGEELGAGEWSLWEWGVSGEGFRSGTGGGIRGSGWNCGIGEGDEKEGGRIRGFRRAVREGYRGGLDGTGRYRLRKRESVCEGAGNWVRGVYGVCVGRVWGIGCDECILNKYMNI